MRSTADAEVAAGLEVRRGMFGEELVEQNFVNASGFLRPIQDWLAGAVWADVWTRDGIDRRTRSLVTIALLAALNRPDELEMHVMAAAANGCSVADVQEILLHVAPYCGAPAALSSARLAERVLRRAGALNDPDPMKEGDDHAVRPQ